MPQGTASPGPSRRDLLAGAASAVRIAWRSAPGCLVASLLLAVAGAVAPVAVAWLTRAALDGLVGGAATATLVSLTAGLAALGLVIAVLPQAEEYLGAETGRRTSLLTSDRLYGRVVAFTGLRRFEDPEFIDRLRLADQSTRAPSEVVRSSLGTGRSVLTLAGFVVSLAVLSPVMTAVVLVAALPTFAAEMVLSRRRAAMLWEIGPVERRELFYGELLTNVRAAKELRLYGIGRFLRDRMLTERRAADSARRRTDRQELGAQGGLAVLGALVAGGGLVVVVVTAGRGGLTPGDLSLFILAMGGVQSALADLIRQLAAGHQQLLIFDHYRAVLATGPDLESPAAPLAAPPLAEGIEFRDVWFRYRDDHDWVLRGVTLRIPHGRAVALVGRNGAGKSTLVKLLCRFYDPTRGSIRWDGADIRTIDPQLLRERVAAVFQDFMQYDLSAAENIGLGDLAALGDRPRIEDAARRAGAHPMLERLPRGYDTMLSTVFMDESDEGDPESGVVLSGGQWQRLALARALVRQRRDLVILDEPCAGMDAEAEHLVHRELRLRRSGGTSLLISHRLGTLRDADQIVVLEQGEVTERGDHAELMALEGTYARLFRLQAAGYEAEPA